MGKMYVEISVHYDGEHITTIEEMMKTSELDWIPDLIRQEIVKHGEELCLRCDAILKNITSRNSVCEDCITIMVKEKQIGDLSDYELDSQGNIIEIDQSKLTDFCDKCESKPELDINCQNCSIQDNGTPLFFVKRE